VQHNADVFHPITTRIDTVTSVAISDEVRAVFYGWANQSLPTIEMHRKFTTKVW